jgi:ATP diphosphatase
MDEVGDLLFVLANLARKLNLDPEACLRHANAKFGRRFQAMEQRAETAGNSLAELDLAAMEALWQAIKQDQRSGG